MRKWGVLLAKCALAGALMLIVLAAGALWLGNRDVPAVTQEEIDLRYAQVLGWMRANEATIDTNKNPALWWMVQAAIQRTGDPYLRERLARAERRMFPSDAVQPSPWMRMLDPKAEITVARDLSTLDDYQLFFHHAMTCLPVQGPHGDSSAYLQAPVCPIGARQIWLGDPACNTHQLIGLRFFRQTGCTPPRDLAPLEDALAANIAKELTVDPVMKDAYIQRVLALVWLGHADKVKPVWIRRALAAQDGDGGWQGHRRMPEFPSWLQPWRIRELLARHWPGRFPPEQVDHDFHATAQGLLLLALLKTPDTGVTGTRQAAPR